jgi:hypothetical protein
MKNLYLTILLFLTSLTIEAQIVAVVDYMKVPENGGTAYLAIENQWKALHQSRVESGKILAWHVWYVWNSGANSPYNYVTVSIYENFNKIENQLTEAEFKKFWGDKTDDFLKKTVASRSLIYSEIYHLETGIDAAVSDKYIVINSIHTDNVSDYIKMENVAYKPMHEEAKKLGTRNSWGIWTRWPSVDNSVQAVAVDGYTKFADINGVDYGALFEKVIAGKKAGEILDMTDQIQKTDEIRTIVKSEIWEFVDGTAPKAN